MLEQTLTRVDIGRAIAKAIHSTQEEGIGLLEIVLEEMINSLALSGSLKLTSFGSFKVLHKKKRRARNPKTMETVIIKPRKVVSFKASNNLKNRVNRTSKTQSP